MSDLSAPGDDSSQTSKSLPEGIYVRKAMPTDADAIHALLRPYVTQRQLLPRTEAEVIELTRHGFMAVRPSIGDTDASTTDAQSEVDVAAREGTCVGFAAIEVYSSKLAELLSLAVHHDYRNVGVGKALVDACVIRARELGIMEVLAISSSEDFFKSCGFDYSLPDQKKAFFCKLRPRHPE